MHDFAANWLGNMRWTLDMVWDGQEAFNKEELREWFVDGTVAGLTRSYGGLTFATIAGAGHYVRPLRFQLILPCIVLTDSLLGPSR